MIDYFPITVMTVCDLTQHFIMIAPQREKKALHDVQCSHRSEAISKAVLKTNGAY